MEYVYGNSSINIAAADAPNGETGCFFQRQGAPKTIGWKAPVKYERDSDTTSILDCTLPANYWQASNANILSSRGWVFQERFLAPRTLWFGADQVAWECRSLKACQTFPNSVQREGFRPNPTEALARLSVAECLSTDLHPKLTTMWFEAIKRYSGGELTFPRDKFVALSGVSRAFATMLRPYPWLDFGKRIL